MGLDMYLRAKSFVWTDRDDPFAIDGFRVAEVELELGYWRKHPDLHGFIVANYGPESHDDDRWTLYTGRDGKTRMDDCQPIPLTVADLKAILDYSERDELLKGTSGFFFGQSYPEDKANTKAILEKAIAWLEERWPEREPAPMEEVASSGFATVYRMNRPPPPKRNPNLGRPDIYYQASW